jgi:hypothetical protein
MFEFINDIGNYESRKISRDKSESGIIVSTCYTSDHGYETALIDSKGVYPVERYSNVEDAKRGHCKWLVFSHDANGKIVNKLGWLDKVEITQIQLSVMK